MSIKQLNPYLNFNGTAAKAIQLYESALGGKTEGLMRFGDVPGMNVAPEHQNRVMHALLRIGEGVIMISDSQPGIAVRACRWTPSASLRARSACTGSRGTVGGAGTSGTT